MINWIQVVFQTAHGRVEGDVTDVEEEPSGELVENGLTRINNLLS